MLDTGCWMLLHWSESPNCRKSEAMAGVIINYPDDRTTRTFGQRSPIHTAHLRDQSTRRGAGPLGRDGSNEQRRLVDSIRIRHRN